MENRASRSQVLGAFGFVIVAVGLSIALLRWTILGVLDLDEKYAAAIIAGCITIFGSVITVVYTQRKTKSREIENSHRPQKAEVYKKFMEKMVIELLKATKEQTIDDPEVRKALESVFLEFTGEVIVWGSPAVVRAYAAFRSGSDGVDILFRVDDLLQAMRADLGNSNWGLARGDLFKLFINDPQNIAPPSKK
jgi:hypothetical protein